MLQSLAVDHYRPLIGNEAHLIDFIKGALDKQEIFYNKMLALTDEDDGYVEDAQVEKRDIKRKLDELEDDGDDVNSDNTVNNDNDNDDNGVYQYHASVFWYRLRKGNCHSQQVMGPKDFITQTPMKLRGPKAL